MGVAMVTTKFILLSRASKRTHNSAFLFMLKHRDYIEHAVTTVAMAYITDMNTIIFTQINLMRNCLV
jgi:glutaminase